VARRSGDDSHAHDAHEGRAHHQWHPHDQPHDQPHGGIRGFVAGILGHSHDAADSIDDALTADARGIRALKLSLVLLGVTAFAQLGVVVISG
jgi:hypothetical protein